MTDQPRNALLPDEPHRAEPMTDDQFRAWALGEAQRSNMTASDLAIDAWVRESAPDDLTIGAARALKGMVRGKGASPVLARRALTHSERHLDPLPLLDRINDRLTPRDEGSAHQPVPLRNPIFECRIGAVGHGKKAAQNGFLHPCTHELHGKFAIDHFPAHQIRPPNIREGHAGGAIATGPARLKWFRRSKLGSGSNAGR